MREPEFWSLSPEKTHPAKTALMPLGFVYNMIVHLRFRIARAEHVGAPVVCVGNLTLGGSGKTPVVLKLAELLQSAGERPAILSRGHGGKNRQALKVDPAQHDAGLTGDEPLMMAATHPIYISPDRRAAARHALRDLTVNPTVLIMDDGLQNPGLRKSLNIAVVDRTAGFGNGAVFPAGPLREKTGPALGRIDAVFVSGPRREPLRPDVAAYLEKARGQHVEIFETELTALNPAPEPVVAFCGIGRPAKFYGLLEQLGYALLARRDFDDHHAYTEKEAEFLLSLAREKGASLVTTRKDAARLQGFETGSARHRLAKICKVLEVEAYLEEEERFKSFVLTHLADARKSQTHTFPENTSAQHKKNQKTF